MVEHNAAALQRQVEQAATDMAELREINADLLAALEVAETLIAADIVRDDAGCLAKIRAAIAKANGGTT